MENSWLAELKNQLISDAGAEKGASLFQKYQDALPLSYRDETKAITAAADILQLEQLTDNAPIQIKLYVNTENRDFPLHLRIFQLGKAIPLSTILPILANFGLITDNEQPNKIDLKNGDVRWISDFAISYEQKELDIAKVSGIFTDAFLNICNGRAENDGFNKLVLGAALNWHEIVILRAYSKYLHQIGFRFSQHYLEQTLARHPLITKDLITLFMALHDPTKARDTSLTNDIENRITNALDAVTSLDEDRILRRFMLLIKATLRTNYFQRDKQKQRKHYFCFKLSSRSIPDMPLPVPLYEIFVYSPHFEGVHLRNTKVARGGIRWSDRPEDFRTEILGLMKAQIVKNAVIVPSGAKGGFVLKRSLLGLTRDEINKEVIQRYTDFISGLLDITDNIVDKKEVRPADVACHDDFDPYLVVAADKGTASFSDLANSISATYQFWLGDAFASGGSAGYDHKKIGITARGAWESIKRHFRELNIDVMQTDVTVVGIGDMSGDVFGNGMMYTKHIKLVAAFNNRHIFIDPTPNPETSFQERVRLFNLPVSAWSDYNKELISAGGGVFDRSLKSITLTPEMKKVLGTAVDSTTPNELIRIILKAPVDLLFNGGIGTYVKAKTESNADVGDRTNDYCRVDGAELRCKVVGEGGNLGFTQLGRVDYAISGGLINTDFIDNSAGVDCSDHEVNLKILLSDPVSSNAMSMQQRNELLSSLTQEVADLVLRDNYDQALVMSFSAAAARHNISLHISHIKELEANGFFNREVENFPDDKKLLERKSAIEGLTRPEIAVLLEYTKIYLKHAILQTNLPEDTHINSVVENAFPPSIRKRFQPNMRDHKLYRDIIATQLTNNIVSTMGITFVHRAHSETGASIEDIVRAFTVASEIFGAPALIKLIDELGFKLPIDKQYDMLFHIRNLIHLATRWFLQSSLLKGNIEDLIEHYSKGIQQLEKTIPNLMAGYTRQYLSDLVNEFLAQGLPRETAQRIATYRAIYTALNIIDISTHEGFDLEKTAEVYFCSGERVNMLWFRDQINHDTREGHWNVLARLTLRDELDAVQRRLTMAILQHTSAAQASALELVDRWVRTNKPSMARWDTMLAALHGSAHTDYSMFFIAIRELLSIILRSMNAPRY